MQMPDSAQTRIRLIEELLTAARADDVDDYGAAYDALIEFERELGDFDSSERVCQVCGCSDEAACPGGCSWVLDNLCSQCLAELATEHLGMTLPHHPPGGGRAHETEAGEP